MAATMVTSMDTKMIHCGTTPAISFHVQSVMRVADFFFAPTRRTIKNILTTKPRSRITNERGAVDTDRCNRQTKDTINKMSELIVIPNDLKLMKRDDGSLCFYQVLGIGHVVWADSLDADLLDDANKKIERLESELRKLRKVEK